MKKLSNFVLLLLLSLSITLMLAACGESGDAANGESGESGSNGESHTHELTYHEYKEWNCVESGNEAYYSCSSCGKCFDDESASLEHEEAYYLRPFTGHDFVSGVCSCGEIDPNYVNGALTEEDIKYIFTPSNYKDIFLEHSDNYGDVKMRYIVLGDYEVVYYESLDGTDALSQYVIYDTVNDELKTYTVKYEYSNFGGNIVEIEEDVNAKDKPYNLVKGFYKKPDSILKHYKTMKYEKYESYYPGYYIEGYRTIVSSSIDLYFCAQNTKDKLNKVQEFKNGELWSETVYCFDNDELYIPAKIDPRHSHSYTWGEIITPAGCTVDGVEGGVCLECGEKTTRPIKAGGHKYADAWSYNGTYHWFEAICGCADAGVIQKGEHNFVGDDCECGRKSYTAGLEYSYNDSDMTCTVTGIGDAAGEIDVVIPSTVNGYKVTKIGRSAFDGQSQMLTVQIPETVLKIDIDAFRGCSGLSSLVIPKGAYVSVDSLAGCSGLVELTTPIDEYTITIVFGSNIYDGSYEISNYNRNTNYIPSSLKKITVNNVRDGVLSSGAFYNMYSLEEIIFDCEVKAIGEYAFTGCTKIKDMIVPDGVEQLHTFAFSGCVMESLSLPDSLKDIGGRAFENCVNLKSAVVPNSVTSIGESAFSGCSSLESISLPFIGFCKSAAFEDRLLGCIFGKRAYEGGVATEQKYFKSGTAYPITFYIPQSLKTVIITGEFASAYGMYNCTGIETVVFADGIQKIDSYVMMGCSGLTSAFVAKSVKEFAHIPFIDCENLQDIYYEGTAEEWSAINFNNEDDKFDERVCFFSETKPEGEGRYWHYGEDGITPVMWQNV